MGARTLVRRWLAASIALGLVLLMAVPVVQGATPPCRVRNVTQDTSGRSLERMVEGARDGDRLHVRGTCVGHVIVDVDVVIRGRGEDPTLAGRGRYTAVRVQRGATVTIRDLTIQKGKGISNEGRLTLRDSLVRLSSQHGIQNGRRLSVISSTVRRNAGGISNWGTLQVTASLIRRNRSGSSGGGILNSYGAKATLTDSTISGNYARYKGGGIYNGDPASGGGGETVTLIASTVTDNGAGFWGGGIGTSCGGIILDASSSVSGNRPNDYSDPCSD